MIESQEEKICREVDVDPVKTTILLALDTGVADGDAVLGAGSTDNRCGESVFRISFAPETGRYLRFRTQFLLRSARFPQHGGQRQRCLVPLQHQPREQSLLCIRVRMGADHDRLSPIDLAGGREGLIKVKSVEAEGCADLADGGKFRMLRLTRRDRIGVGPDLPIEYLRRGQQAGWGFHAPLARDLVEEGGLGTSQSGGFRRILKLGKALPAMVDPAHDVQRQQHSNTDPQQVPHGLAEKCGFRRPGSQMMQDVT